MDISLTPHARHHCRRTVLTERRDDILLITLNRPGRRNAVNSALELASGIARSGPLAVAATKAILSEQWDWAEADFWHRQGEISGPVLVSQDAREGAVAFKEKRDPVWTGR